ncbi:MAG: hypothetical protein Aurels2KO_26970 [Aureliella sp.]
MYLELLIQFFIRWLRSQNLRRLALQGMATFLLPVLALGFVMWGYATSSETVYATCIAVVDQTLESAGEEGIAGLSEKAGQDLHVPLNRILQLGKSNERVVYFVATQSWRQGRIAEAVRQMRSIAPAGEKGFPPAHDWLARVTLESGARATEADKAALWNDLEIAESSMAILPPELTAAYADYLFQIGQRDKALEILRARSQVEPKLNMKFVKLAAMHGKPDYASDAVERVRLAIESDYEERERDEAYYVRKVDLERFVVDAKQLLSIVVEGLAAFPDSKVLRRARAELELAKRDGNDGAQQEDVTERLQRIRTAFDIDPASPGVLNMIAQELAYGTNIPADMRSALAKSVRDGSAPTEAQFIIANLMLVTGKSGGVNSAIPLFASAARNGRISAAAINNLAYALLQIDEPNTEGALELIDRALSFQGVSNSSRASIYDTQGDARAMAGDHTGVVESYERALELVGTKINSRRKLAAAYDKLGMTDLARGQQRRIAELEEEAKR